MKITVKPPGGPVLFERTLEAREVVRVSSSSTVRNYPVVPTSRASSA